MKALNPANLIHPWPEGGTTEASPQEVCVLALALPAAALTPRAAFFQVLMLL